MLFTGENSKPSNETTLLLSEMQIDPLKLSNL